MPFKQQRNWSSKKKEGSPVKLDNTWRSFFKTEDVPFLKEEEIKRLESTKTPDPAFIRRLISKILSRKQRELSEQRKLIARRMNVNPHEIKLAS